MICKTELHRSLVCVTFVNECVKCEVCGELAYNDLLLKQTYFFSLLSALKMGLWIGVLVCDRPEEPVAILRLFEVVLMAVECETKV